VPAPIDLNTPVLLGLLVLTLAILVFSAFVAVDSLRRRMSDFAGVIEGRWFYAVPQTLFFFLFIGSRLAPVVRIAPWLAYAIFAVPLILIQQMAYLLRVVFPTRKRLELRLDAECAALRDEESRIAAGEPPTREQKRRIEALRRAVKRSLALDGDGAKQRRILGLFAVEEFDTADEPAAATADDALAPECDDQE